MKLLEKESAADIIIRRLKYWNHTWSAHLSPADMVYGIRSLSSIGANLHAYIAVASLRTACKDWCTSACYHDNDVLPWRLYQVKNGDDLGHIAQCPLC